MRKITPILYISAFLINTLLFGAFAKSGHQNSLNSKYYSYSPELYVMSYLSLDYDTFSSNNSENSLGVDHAIFKNVFSTSSLANTVLLLEDDVEYCVPTYSNTGDRLSAISTVNAVQNVTYSVTSSPVDNYDDRTDEVIQQAQGLSFTITTTYVGGSNGVNVWIDWNDDGEFDNSTGSTEKVFSMAGSGAMKTGTITIPADIPLGEYRMRVRAQYGSSANPGPCEEVSYGSTVDFTLEVLEGPDCMPPSGLNTEALSLTTMELSWESDGDSFEVEWGEAGFVVGEEEGTLIEDLTTTSTTVTTEIDVPYEFYVRRNCGSEDGDSFWVGPIAFQTGYCTPIYVYGCSSGAKISNFVTSGAILNISNNTGTTNCGVNGYNNFAEMAVAAPEDLEVTFAVTVGSYSGGVRVWIDWNGNGDFEEDELVGASTSTISSGSVFTTSFSVPEGTALGDYRIRVRVVESNTTFGPCTSQNYGEAEDYTFSVIEAPACMPPSALGTGAMTFTSAELTWTSDGDLFEIEWAEAGVIQGEGTTIEDVTDTTYSLGDLEEETEYRFYVRQDCGEEDNLSLWAGPYYFYTGYCVGASQYSGNRILGFSTIDAYINIANMNNGTANDYSDYTDLAVTHSAGGSFNYAVAVPSYTRVDIWIDYNNNLTLEADELVGQHDYSSSNVTFTGTVILPEDLEEGDYRIRVRSQNYYNAPIDPCVNVSEGETEDYTLSVIEEPECLPPTGLDAEAITLTSAELSWTSDGNSFQVEWGEEGFTQGTGTMINNLTTSSTTVVTVMDIPYEYYVRRNCDEDGFSYWAGPFPFMTGYCVPAYVYGCSSGSKISNFVISDAIINIVNNTGTSECGEGGYNDFTAMIAAAPEDLEISFAITIGSYSGGVKLWIDWNGNGTFEEDELIASSASTISSGGVFTGTFEVPAGTQLGNYRMRARVVEGTTSFGACSTQNYGEVEDYTFSVIETPTCMPPSGVSVLSVTEDSLTVGWTAVAGQDTWEVLVLPAGSPAPTETSTGFETTIENPYTVEGLDPNTEYEVYVRANCGDEDGLSLWAGPAKTLTTQIPADLPYEEGFEGSDEWSYSGTGDNQWVFGTAVNNGGTHALYVSKDEGDTHTYNTSSTTVAHAYRDFFVIDVDGELDIQFDWIAMGEGTSYKYDYLNVWILPSTNVLVPGVLIENTVNEGYKVVDKYNNNEEFLTEQIIFGISALPEAYDSGYFRIVFEWVNNSYGGTQPPAAIDNLVIKKVPCPAVIDLQSEILNGGTSVKLTWTPTGSETQWEVFIIEFDDTTIPDEDTVGIIVDSPQYIYSDGVADQFYKFYVRPICVDGDRGYWSEPGIISFIPPPGCAVVEADIEFSDIELTPNEDGVYIICQEEPVNLTFGSSYYDIPGTDEYTVEEIDYRPPFPFTGGGAIALTIDDRWSETVELGFNFCFFGNSFDKVLIGTNGAITFSIKDEVEGGRYTPNTGSGYSYNQQLPFSAGPTSTSPPYVNAIFGVMQDLNPEGDNSPNDYSVNYQVIGKAPCRTLVFNIYHLGLFSCGYDPEDIEGSTQTSQIVLYEGTNIIEVYVKNRPSCPGFNSGSGVLGIQNADGTIAYTPPGRNTGAWTATEEAWRFSPSGESSVSFEWEKDGEFYSSEHEINVSITESVRYTARATYQICGQDFSLFKEFKFLKEDFEIAGIKDLELCSRKPGEIYDFDLRSNDSLVLGDLKPEEYTIEYFENESDIEEGENPLEAIYETLVGKTLYVKLTNLKTGCFKFRAFSLIIAKPIIVSKPDDVWVCGSYNFPSLKPGEAYYTAAYGEGVRYEEGDVFDVLGVHTIYVYTVTELGCFGQSTFELEVVKSPTADIIKDQVLQCTTFVLPTPSEHNRYFALPNGKGKEYYGGQEIREPSTIYIYAEIVGEDGLACVEESSFTIAYDDCPLPKGISPNGDGLNDRFDLAGYGVLDLKIYNRYGTEVFSYGATYVDEWHGQDKSGNALPDGTYYYVVITNGKVRTGWVQINR